jgi:glutathione S-transferase
MPELVLYDWKPSPFCLKVRAILDFKGLRYERRNVLGKSLLDLNRRGRTGKVPALAIDGDIVCDSTDIAYALERLAPTPSIFPASPRDRALCHVLEDWADEALYWVGLYFQWWDPAGAAMVPRAFGTSVLGRVAFQAYAHRVRGQLIGQGVARKTAEHNRRDLERHLDAAEAMLAGRSYLLGDAPTLCDFAWLGQLVYLSHTPVGGGALAGRSAINAFLERMKGLRAAPGTGARTPASEAHEHQA